MFAQRSRRGFHSSSAFMLKKYSSWAFITLKMKSARCLETPGTDCTATWRCIPEESNAQLVPEIEFAHKWTDMTAYRKLFHL